MAELATLAFGLTPNLVDIDLKWSGFNDSMPNFIKETLLKIGKMKESDTRAIFNQVKEEMLVDLKNVYLGQTFQQIFAHLPSWINETSPESRVLREALEKYTYE
jgi:secreted Zn-dependent insulinase-like peptidase